MHQPMHCRRDKAVVDEEVFLDGEAVVATLEVTGAIAVDTMPQRQVLSARRGPDRIGLHETHPRQREFKRRRREQAPRNGEATKMLEGLGFSRCAHRFWYGWKM